jgi:hypothetical protein
MPEVATNEPTNLDELLTPAALEEESNGVVKQRTLERWRKDGQGPRYLKLGHKVAYRRRDWLAFLDQQTRTFTRDRKRA